MGCVQRLSEAHLAAPQPATGEEAAPHTHTHTPTCEGHRLASELAQRSRIPEQGRGQKSASAGCGWWCTWPPCSDMCSYTLSVRLPRQQSTLSYFVCVKGRKESSVCVGRWCRRRGGGVRIRPKYRLSGHSNSPPVSSPPLPTPSPLPLQHSHLFFFFLRIFFFF